MPNGAIALLGIDISLVMFSKHSRSCRWLFYPLYFLCMVNHDAITKSSPPPLDNTQHKHSIDACFHFPWNSRFRCHTWQDVMRLWVCYSTINSWTINIEIYTLYWLSWYSWLARVGTCKWTEWHSVTLSSIVRQNAHYKHNTRSD